MNQRKGKNMKTLVKMLPVISVMMLTACVSEKSDDPDTGGGGDPVNQAPSISFIQDSVTVDEGDSVQTLSFNAVDPDGDALTYNLSFSGAGSAVLIDNAVEYTPPANVSADTAASMTVTVSDGKLTSSAAASVSVVNAANTPPRIVLDRNDYFFTENEDQVISVVLEDADGDDLKYEVREITAGSGVTVNFDVKPTAEDPSIRLEIGEIDIPFTKFVYELELNDGQETVTKTINVTINNSESQVRPTISITGGDIQEISESNGGTISFVATDPDGEVASLTLDVGFSHEIPLAPNAIPAESIVTDLVAGTITLSNLNVIENTDIIVTLTVSDGVNEPNTDTVTIRILDDVQAEADNLSVAYAPIKAQFDGLKGRADEVTIFQFYRDFTLLMDTSHQGQLTTMAATLTSSLAAEEQAVDVYVTAIDAFLADEDRDIGQIDAFIDQVAEMKLLVDAYGNTGVTVINQAQSLLGILPALSASEQVIEVRPTLYSRYVGNTSYGFASDTTGWEFSAAYKFMESVNILSSQCQ
jgi:hypothetical protein